MSSPRPWRHAVLAGVAGVLLIQAAGRLIEIGRLGASDDAAFRKVERHVSRGFAAMAVSLESLAARLAVQPEVVAGIGGEPASLPRLFAATRAAAVAEGVTDVAVTVYGAAASARAWAGRPSEIPARRVLGDRSFFVAPGPLGLRLVYIEPVLAQPVGAGPPRRIGSIAAERVLSPAPGVADTPSDAFRLDTPIADVVVRPRAGQPALGPAPRAFELRSPHGEQLLEAAVVRRRPAGGAQRLAAGRP